jgi:hypothetical protein
LMTRCDKIEALSQQASRRLAGFALLETLIDMEQKGEASLSYIGSKFSEIKPCHQQLLTNPFQIGMSYPPLSYVIVENLRGQKVFIDLGCGMKGINVSTRDKIDMDEYNHTQSWFREIDKRVHHNLYNNEKYVDLCPVFQKIKNRAQDQQDYQHPDNLRNEVLLGKFPITLATIPRTLAWLPMPSGCHFTVDVNDAFPEKTALTATPAFWQTIKESPLGKIMEDMLTQITSYCQNRPATAVLTKIAEKAKEQLQKQIDEKTYNNPNAPAGFAIVLDTLQDIVKKRTAADSKVSSLVVIFENTRKKLIETVPELKTVPSSSVAP